MKISLYLLVLNQQNKLDFLNQITIVVIGTNCMGILHVHIFIVLLLLIQLNFILIKGSHVI